MIEALIFDLFETLVTEFDSGTVGSPGPLDELFGDRLEDFRRYWKATREDRHSGKSGSFRDILIEACRRFDIVPDPRLVRAAHAGRIETKAACFLEPDPRVAEMLSALKRHHVKIGLVSNCEREEVQAWGRWRPSRLFDDHIFSFSVGLTKPDPAIYELACRRLGVPAKSTLYAGDGAGGELDGARRAGLKVCRVTWFSEAWGQVSPAEPGSPDAREPQELVALVLSEQSDLDPPTRSSLPPSP